MPMNYRKNLVDIMQNVQDEHDNAVGFDTNDLYYGLDNLDNIADSGKEKIHYLAVDDLYDNPNNHFSKMKGEDWNEFVGSVKENGVLVPLTVRPVEKGYEILSGHNRKNAALKAGLSEVPCLIVDADDVKASVIMALSNKQRESTTDLEWGWAYRNTYDALKKSVGRPKIEDNSDDGENVPTMGTFSKKPRTVDIVAEKYGIGKGTVDRKIRLTYLIPELYKYCSENGIPQEAMVDISYLTEDNQKTLLAKLEMGFELTKEKAKALKDIGTEQPLSENDFETAEIPLSEKKEKKPKVPKYEIADYLFPETVSKKKDRTVYINKALAYIIENQIEL